jgi:hypothetical protein
MIPKETPSNYQMAINWSVSPKSKRDRDNNRDTPSKAIVSIAGNQDTWHTTADNKRKPKYPIWPKDT